MEIPIKLPKLVEGFDLANAIEKAVSNSLPSYSVDKQSFPGYMPSMSNSPLRYEERRSIQVTRVPSSLFKFDERVGFRFSIDIARPHENLRAIVYNSRYQSYDDPNVLSEIEGDFNTFVDALYKQLILPS